MEQMHFLCLQNFNNGSENKFAMKMQSSPALHRQGEMTSLQVSRVLATLPVSPTCWVQRVLPGAGKRRVSGGPSPSRAPQDQAGHIMHELAGVVDRAVLSIHGPLGLGQGKQPETLAWLLSLSPAGLPALTAAH